ncbi:hypothetical protein [Rhizobium leguminosarum]|uniref:hypothetical protein n=1 Tax=Rhizobium leguminosarum TaxID=384 RepID=UPI001C94C02E|nr:hypothetical protein [Rhizobium leguminosarum]
MLFMTAAVLGVCVGKMHSAFSIVSIAFLVVATLVIATLFSLSPASYLNLVAVIFGYNAGLIMLIAGELSIRLFRTEINRFVSDRIKSWRRQT